jgi:hypothetical protein
LDTEWLLSTLFDASLLSTFKAAGLRRLFFVLASRFDVVATIGMITASVAICCQRVETITLVAAGLFAAPAQ